MVMNKKFFRDMTAIEPKAIVLGNGTRVYASFRGSVHLQTWIGTVGELYERIIILQNVLYVPKLKCNLLSCSKLCMDGYTVNFNSRRCVGLYDGIIQFQGKQHNGIFHVKCLPVLGHSAHANVALIGYRQNERKEGMNLWHARLGHAYPGRINNLLRTKAVKGLHLIKEKTANSVCSDCMKGKQTKQSLRVNQHRSGAKGDCVHSDVCGPMSVESFSGARYFVSFVDDYSGFIKIIPIAKKSDVKKRFIWYHAWLERKFVCSIKRLHSDNGGEFIALSDYLKEKGIEHTMSPSYSPNLNGVAERTNRTIVESARSMLEHASLPRKFWAEAVVYPAKIQNVFNSPRDKKRSRYEIISGMKPSVHHFRVFGCLAWHHIPKELRKKLDAKSEVGIVLNCMETKQFKLWIPSRRVTLVARDVKVVENEFPARNWKDETYDEEQLVQYQKEDHKTVPKRLLPTVSSLHPQQSGAQINREHEHVSEDQEQNPMTSQDVGMVTHYPVTEQENETSGTEEVFGSTNEDSSTSSRYPSRNRKSPSFYVPGSASTAYIAKANMIENEPSSVQEALSMTDAVEWKKAIASELGSLRNHATWDVVEGREDIKVLPTRFVFTRKRNAEGRVIRYKARLVVRGYLQGDIDHTFAPVVDFSTVRLSLAVAVQRSYLIHQMDIRTAFLHGDISGDVFISPPEGVRLCKTGEILKLRKGLYGLKQAPRLWHQKWCSVMTKLGFASMISDPCMYQRNGTWLLVYVDDIIIITKDEDSMKTVKHELGRQLDVKDLGVLRSFLGVTFIRKGSDAWLTQEHYV